MTVRASVIWLLAGLGLSACQIDERSREEASSQAAAAIGYGFGRAAEWAGDDEAALDIYREVIQQAPTMLLAHVALQDLALGRGDRARLLREYASARTGDPRLDRYLRARIASPPEGRRDLEDLARGRDDVAAGAATDLSAILLREGKPREAFQAAMTAVYLTPGWERALHARALALEARGMDGSAETAFAKAAEAMAPPAETAAGIARVRLRAGRREDAAAALDAVEEGLGRGVEYRLARADVEAAFDREEGVVRALEAALKDAPNDPRPRRRLGLLLHRAGRSPLRARYLLSPLAGPESRDVEVLVAAGELDLAAGRARDAIRRLERAVALDGGETASRRLLEAKLAAGRFDEVADADVEGDARRLVIRARARRRLGRGEEARADLREALRLDPDGEDAASDLALLLADLGRVDEALEILASRPASRANAMARGRVLLVRGDLAGADRALRVALAGGTGGPSVYRDLAEVARRQRRRAERIRWLRAGLVAHPGDARLTLALAEAVGVTPEAEALVHGLLRRTPPPRGARPALARLLLARGVVAEALRIAIRATEERGEDPEARAALGDAYAAAGRPDEAETAYEAALVRDPRCSGALLGRARLLARLGPGRTRDAARAYEKALAADPWSTEVRLGLARIRLERGEDGRTIETLAPLVAGADPVAEALDLTARAQERLGSLEAATESLRRLARLRARDPDVHLRLGRLYRKRGRLAESELYLRRALKLGADPEAVKKLLAGQSR